MRFVFLLSLIVACFMLTGCPSIQIQQELTDQNVANTTQLAADAAEMADMLDKAAKGDATWKESWDNPDETDPDLKGAIKASILNNAAAAVQSAQEINKIAKDQE